MFSEPSGLNQYWVFPTGIFRWKPASDKHIDPVQRPKQHCDSTKIGFKPKVRAQIHSAVCELFTSPCTSLPKQSTHQIILSRLLWGGFIKGNSGVSGKDQASSWGRRQVCYKLPSQPSAQGTFHVRCWIPVSLKPGRKRWLICTQCFSCWSISFLPAW